MWSCTVANQVEAEKLRSHLVVSHFLHPINVLLHSGSYHRSNFRVVHWPYNPIWYVISKQQVPPHGWFRIGCIDELAFPSFSLSISCSSSGMSKASAANDVRTLWCTIMISYGTAYQIALASAWLNPSLNITCKVGCDTRQLVSSRKRNEKVCWNVRAIWLMCGIPRKIVEMKAENVRREDGPIRALWVKQPNKNGGQVHD